MDGPIKLNKVKCLVCGDILISETAKEETCSCGAVTIGGGHFAVMRKGDPKDFKEMSKFNENLVPFNVKETNEEK